jgi:hypothetical protein
LNQNENSNKSPKDSEVNDKIIRFGAILVAIAVIIACFSYTKVETLLLKIGLFVLGGILGLIGGFIIFVVAVGSRLEAKTNNIFLYDKKKKQDMPVSELTVSEIRNRLAEYMSAFKFRGRLYIGDLFDEKYTHVPEAIKPLFCYELLCQIGENRSNAEIFLSFGLECAEIFSKYLSQTEDYELALKIKGFIIDYSEGNKNTEEFQEFLVSQKEQLEQKMLNYTVKNIEKFV